MFIGAGGLRPLRALDRSAARDTRSPALLLFVCGVFFTSYTANSNTAIQLASPDYIRGRVLGLYYYAWNGLAPFGALLVGWLCDRGGTELAFAVGGACALAMTALGAARGQAPAAWRPRRPPRRHQPTNSSRPSANVVGSRSSFGLPTHADTGVAMAQVAFERRQQDLPGRHARGQRHQPGDPRRRVHGARRPVRVRQDDRAAHGRRPRGDLRGRADDRRPGREPRAVARPRHRDGLPELRALPAPLASTRTSRSACG